MLDTQHPIGRATEGPHQLLHPDLELLDTAQSSWDTARLVTNKPPNTAQTPLLCSRLVTRGRPWYRRQHTSAIPPAAVKPAVTCEAWHQAWAQLSSCQPLLSTTLSSHCPHTVPSVRLHSTSYMYQQASPPVTAACHLWHKHKLEYTKTTPY